MIIKVNFLIDYCCPISKSTIEKMIGTKKKNSSIKKNIAIIITMENLLDYVVIFILDIKNN